MGKLEQARRVYEEIEIPAELKIMVNETIEKSRIVHGHSHKAVPSKKGYLIKKWSAMGMLAAIAICMIALNTSSTFAAAAQNIPFIGRLAKVFTIRVYDTADVDMTVYGKVPGVELSGVTVEEKDFSAEVNERIQEKCDTYMKDAVERVKEYKEAFLATGGTEEEFEAKEIVITVDYEITSQTNDTVSFNISGTESWVSAYSMREYYNLDLGSLTYLTLEDLLGESYVSIVNDSIKKQMHEREATNEGIVFWTEAEGGFSTIDKTTAFYINGEGKPVVVFEKYEVAPGAMGNVEFVIEPISESY